MQESLLKRIWHFIWEDNSIWSWIVNIILAYVIIKYAFFPILGLILGSKFPVVAVVSSSMGHDGRFDEWWSSPALCGQTICTQEKFYDQYNISKEQFKTFKFRNGFNKGDVMVLTSAKNAEVGDTIVYFSQTGRPIIHRAIDLDPLQTKGDHNRDQIQTLELNEKNVQGGSVIGKASLRVPFLGYVKIVFVEFLNLFGITVR